MRSLFASIICNFGLFFIIVLVQVCCPSGQNSVDGGSDGGDGTSIPLGTLCFTFEGRSEFCFSGGNIQTSRSVASGNVSFAVDAFDRGFGDTVQFNRFTIEASIPDGATLPRSANTSSIGIPTAVHCSWAPCLMTCGMNCWECNPKEADQYCSESASENSVKITQLSSDEVEATFEGKSLPGSCCGYSSGYCGAGDCGVDYPASHSPVDFQSFAGRLHLSF